LKLSLTYERLARREVAPIQAVADTEKCVVLTMDDPAPVKVTRPDGASPYVMIGDHAGRAIPQALKGLGVAPDAMDRHIAWDIGVSALGARLSALLDATFIEQVYSRLVLDCNRRPGAPDRAPAVSDGVAVPGNANLSAADLADRVREIHDPYQAAIVAALDARAGRPTWLVSLHSFTPVMNGVPRPWRFGVLHRGDSDLSRRVLARLRAELGDAAGDNQPYAMNGTDNTVPLHVDARGIDYLELEVRQDLLADAAGVDAVAAFVARLLE
jgi:predicted N-formylglutamate amidohydrolase